MELVLLFFGSFGAVIVLFLLYSGYFNPVVFKTTNLPEYSLALVPFRGDYKDAAVLQVELMQQLQGSGLTLDTTAGIYFDNPKEVKSDKLRSLVGVVIKDEEVDSFKKIGSKAELIRLNSVKAYHTTWAYKSGLSIMLAIMKVYPALLKRAKRQGFDVYQSVELYDFTNKTLHYYFPKESVESLWKTDSSN